MREQEPLVTCAACGKALRWCNLERHIVAKHPDYRAWYYEQIAETRADRQANQ